MDNGTLFSEAADIVNHIALLDGIAKADGIVLEKERQFVKEMADVYLSSFGAMGWDELMRLVGDVSASELESWRLSLREKPVLARNLLKDMITLGWIDGDFCQAERDCVVKAADDFGIAREFVDEMSEVVSSIMKNTRKLEQLVFT